MVCVSVDPLFFTSVSLARGNIVQIKALGSDPIPPGHCDRDKGHTDRDHGKADAPRPPGVPAEDEAGQEQQDHRDGIGDPERAGDVVEKKERHGQRKHARGHQREYADGRDVVRLPEPDPKGTLGQRDQMPPMRSISAGASAPAASGGSWPATSACAAAASRVARIARTPAAPSERSARTPMM